MRSLNLKQLNNPQRVYVITIVVALLILSVFLLYPTNSWAIDLNGEDLGFPTGAKTDTDGLTTVLNAVFGLAGALAVVFVIVGGLKYIIGSGKPEELQKAKNTILYAVVGLIISLFAMAIVNFVISRL